MNKRIIFIVLIMGLIFISSGLIFSLDSSNNKVIISLKNPAPTPFNGTENSDDNSNKEDSTNSDDFTGDNNIGDDNNGDNGDNLSNTLLTDDEILKESQQFAEQQQQLEEQKMQQEYNEQLNKPGLTGFTLVDIVNSIKFNVRNFTYVETITIGGKNVIKNTIDYNFVENIEGIKSNNNSYSKIFDYKVNAYYANEKGNYIKKSDGSNRYTSDLYNMFLLFAECNSSLAESNNGSLYSFPINISAYNGFVWNNSSPITQELNKREITPKGDITGTVIYVEDGSKPSEFTIKFNNSDNKLVEIKFVLTNFNKVDDFTSLIK